MNRFCLPAAAAAAALTVALSPQLATANIIPNGGFEADTLGSTTVTDFLIQTGVDAVVVGALTEGSNAVEITSTDESAGKFSALETKLGSAFNSDSPLLTIGQEYTVSGDYSSSNGLSTVTLVLQNSDAAGNQAPGAYGVFSSGPAAAGDGTLSFSRDFVYYGGEISFAGQVSPFDGDTAGGAVGTFDNFAIDVVPEPASALVLSTLSVLALRRRRA